MILDFGFWMMDREWTDMDRGGRMWTDFKRGDEEKGKGIREFQILN